MDLEKAESCAGRASLFLQLLLFVVALQKGKVLWQANVHAWLTSFLMEIALASAH